MIYIKKRAIINIFLVFLVVIVSLFYRETIGKNALSVFLNNERIMPICSVDIPDKRIALTFDAAWGDQYTQDILDILKRYNIKSSFFLGGAWVDKYPDTVVKIRDGGHEIGNHSTSHIKMVKLPKNKIITEIRETELKIKKLTGVNTKLFRAPFGEYDDELISTVKEMKYNTIQWDVDSFDWKGLDEKDIYNNITGKVGNGSIVLFHTNVINTPKVLPKVIEDLRKGGYKFVTVSELMLKENYYIDNTGRQKAIIR